MMKITIVLGPFLSALPGPAGAVEKRWQGMAQDFVAAGHQVTILEKDGVARESSAPAYVGLRGFERPRSLVAALFYDFIYSLRALAALPAADITVTNTFFLPTKPFLALQRLFRKKAGLIIPSVERMPKGKVRFFGDLKLILTVSNVVGKAMEAELLAGKRSVPVCVINNPVDTSVFRPNAERRSEPPSLVFMYAGRIAEEKGIELLISSFREAQPDLPNGSKLIIVGPHEVRFGGGGEDYLKRCQNLASNLPIEFRPAIRQPADLAAALQEADIFVYPSFAEQGEAFPIAPLEAMACGCLVVVSDLECYNDYILHGANGLIFDYRTNNVTNLAAALRNAANDQTLRAQLQAEGVRTSEKFSYNNIAVKHLDLFESVTSVYPGEEG